jgi:hypothetical protein
MVIARGACVLGSALALAGSRDPARPGKRRDDERVTAQRHSRNPASTSLET